MCGCWWKMHMVCLLCIHVCYKHMAAKENNWCSYLYGAFHDCMVLTMVWKIYCVLLLVSFWFCMHGTMGENWYFAQVSSSRLDENRRSSSWFLLELSLKRRAFVLSDESSRSGERVSLKQEFVELGGFFAWVVAQAEDLNFERRTISPMRECPAQARTRKAFQCSLFVVSPKREPVAWAKDTFRLSEGPWLERD